MGEDWLQRIGSEPLLGVLAVTTGALVGLALVLLCWLVARALWAERQRRRQASFWSELGAGLVVALADPAAAADWLAAARAYPRAVVRHCLNAYLVRSAGDYRDQLGGLYRALGLLDDDRAQLRSRRWGVRMRALRRMAMIVGPDDRRAILALADEGGEMRLLVAQILGRIGSADDVLALLKSWTVTSRLGEYPVHVMIDGMSHDALRDLLRHWQDLDHSQAMQRILLAAAARSVPAACSELLPDAARHASLEVRIAAARASGTIASAETFTLLGRLATDDAWEVRAQAVKALGSHRRADARQVLVAALSDKSFWVRQNAAAALGLHGADGVARLRQVKEASSDRFARDAADHVLTDMALAAEPT